MATLKPRSVIGKGSFGEVCLSWWEGGHLDVAVKVNGVSCMNVSAIDNERRLLELLLQHPHRNILVVYGIVTDAPDGNVRLVMAYCQGGSLDGYLSAIRASSKVCLNRICPCLSSYDGADRMMMVVVKMMVIPTWC